MGGQGTVCLQWPPPLVSSNRMVNKVMNCGSIIADIGETRPPRPAIKMLKYKSMDPNAELWHMAQHIQGRRLAKQGAEYVSPTLIALMPRR